MGYATRRDTLKDLLPRRRGRAFLAVTLLTGWLVVGLVTAGVGLAAKAGNGAATAAAPVAGESVSERLTRMELEIRQLREEQAAKAADIETAKTNAGNALATLESHKDRISDAHSRVSDVNFSVTLSSAILSLLFAGVVAVGGVLTYQKAVEEARSGVNRWFVEEKDKLHTIIDQFITDSYNKTCTYEREAKKHLDDHIKDLDSKHNAAIDLIQSRNLGPIDESERKDLVQIADTTKEKPENDFTAQDWSAKAFAAYYGGDFSSAAEYWLKSASSKDTTQQNAAKSLFNRGFALGELKRPNKELEAYDAVITRFGNETKPEIRELVATAMVNKGVTLGRLKRPQEALEVYDAVIARFVNDTTQGIREQVTRAFSN
ncbi:tetratricopeptide repeat protein, partial [Desulfovibrio sp. TomC]|uniref:tetratricopeptide repeat protein n=1 Tax=Desulfovibrio sp. TomC TaxID=1562888 RepID=UPI0005BAD873